MKIIKGTVTAPQGFQSHGVWCGIKKSGKPDLALIFSKVPAVASAVFTKNSVKAAPLVLSQKHLRAKKARAIVCNSGNANCFTGDFGMIYAARTAEIVAQLLGVKKEEVVVASTGIIGKPLPFQKIADGAPALVSGLGQDKKSLAAKAIMTTDTFVKEIAVETIIGGKKVKVAGCAKGSGMIAPNMATMLGFITTDAAIDAPSLSLVLKEVTEQTFNSITVDGCTSTNDMVVVLANGLAGNKIIAAKGKDYEEFRAALYQIALDLSLKIVKDGEGAQRLITVNVQGAKTQQQARRIGLAVANSNLVKTANYTDKPNWGRVAQAIGSLGIARLDETNMKIGFKCDNKKDITIWVTLGLGEEEATVYTCDLTAEYVRINGEYT
ncbi:MAG: bifunctional glutamate N-acetyltransferase/amino-acid acetyltransferase ArgJ [Candidatus Omnitrophica bacterium]|nr:bifunctional glutamate N-acetyltransferase/amino-acid acetyltransferase ArgJ [Candidatus Omnitrophota bacterium]